MLGKITVIIVKIHNNIPHCENPFENIGKFLAYVIMKNPHKLLQLIWPSAEWEMANFSITQRVMNATIPLCKRRCERKWANTPIVK